MSWIPCTKHCRYQQDGYCCLDQITPLGSNADEECAYFSQIEESLPFQSAARLGDIADSN